MKKSEFLAYFLDLFDPNPICYAFRDEWTETDDAGQTKNRVAYIPSNYEGHKATTREKVAEVVRRVGTSRLDPISLNAHLQGEVFIGAYPVHPETNSCKFFCADYDGKTGDPWAEVMDAYETFTDEAELPVYIERSQSGNGYHLFGFLEEHVDAGTIRRALKQFILKTETFDRFYPLQSSLSALKPLGNLLALPLAGQRTAEHKSVFVRPVKDENGKWVAEEVEKQSEFLLEVQRISAARIEELAAAAPELPEDRPVRAREGAADGSMPGVTKITDARFGCEWVRWQIDNPEEVSEPEWYALACQLAQLRNGRETFHEISRLSDRYSPRNCDSKFDHAVEQNAPHTCAYIRQNFNGPECTCDKRFPGKITHPYELAKIPIFDLIKTTQIENAVVDAVSGLDEAIEWAMAVEMDPQLGMGLTTGIQAIDDHLGFRNSTLNVLAARPSIGKSALYNEFAYRMALRDIPVYVFSLEMSAQQNWIRLLCRAAEVDATEMRKGRLDAEDWKAIRYVQAELRKLPRFPYYIDDTTRDSRQIMEVAWNLQEEHGKGMVVIDYLGLMDWLPGENEYAGTTRNSKECKLMAKALDCPVLALHQFNRSGDDMGVDAQTFDSWLRSTGQIDQDSDMILYLMGERGPGIKERMLVKQKDRDGEAGVRIPLEFNQPLMRFGEQGTWLRLAGSQASFGEPDEGQLAWEGLE